MTTLREAAQMALDALESKWKMDRTALDRRAIVALRAALAQPEPTEFTPMPPVEDDGWCEWSYPKHEGYLMKCCDCGLVHEVEFHVLGNIERQQDGSENGEVMENGYQVGLRMRRHSEQTAQEQIMRDLNVYGTAISKGGERIDPASIYKQPEQEPVAWLSQGGDVSRSRKYFEEMGFNNLIPLYTAPPQREWQRLTDEEIREFEIWLDDEEEKRGWNPPADIVKYIEAKLREKNA